MLAAAAALIAGEPRRALRIVDEAAVDAAAAPEWASAIRAAARRLDADWWPGDTSVAGSNVPGRRAAPAAPTGDVRLDLVLAVVARVEPDLMNLRSLSRALARLHPREVREMLLPELRDYEALAAAAAPLDVAAAAALTLDLADIDRLSGAAPDARERLAWARLAYERLGDDAGTARCELLEADWVIAPSASTATLGFDLDDLDAERPVPPADVAAQARDRLHRARRLFRRAGAPRGVAATHTSEACLDLLTGDPRTAGRRVRQARELARSAGDTAAVRLAETQCIVTAVAAGRLSAASDAAVDVIVEWAHVSGSRSYARGLARLLHAAGRSWRRSRQIEEARVTLSRAHDLARRLGAADHQVDILTGDLSPLYGGINSIGPAIVHYRRALQDCVDQLAGPDPIGSGAWLRLGPVTAGLTPLMMADRSPDGLSHAADMAKLALSRMPPGAVAAEGALDHRRLDREVSRLLQAGAESFLRNTAEPDVEGFSMSVLARQLMDTVAVAEVFVPIYRGRKRIGDGDPDGANRWFALALDRARDQGARGRRNAMSALLALGRSAEARRLMADQVPDEDPARRASDWSWVGADDRAAAEVRCIPPEVVAHAEWRQRAAWGAVLARANDTAAEPLLAEAIVDLETLIARTPRDAFRLSLLSDGAAHELYAMAARTAHRDGRPAEAFARADRLRCLRLDTLLHTVAARSRQDRRQSSALLRWSRASAQWTGAYDTFAALAPGDEHGQEQSRSAIAAAQEHLESAEATLERTAPGILTRRRKLSAPTGLAQARAALPDGALLVVYLVSGNRLLIWAVDDDDATVAELEIDPDDLLIRAHRFHNHCAGLHQLADTADAEALARLLLDPVAARIRGRQRLLVVPSGPMDLLPFAALPFDDDVLGAGRSVSMLPATSVLTYSAGRSLPSWDRSALVVGDPAYAPARGLSSLPGTLHEARAVAAHYGVQPLVRKQATAARVRRRAAGAAVIHLATHGHVSLAAPTLSSVALAGTDGLTVADLLGLSIDADLVVLSACDTGRSEGARVGGVAGLVRGLLAAGARNALVSLWAVDDAVTCVLMDHFARSLAGGAAIADALARAQAAVRAMDGEARSAAYHALQAEGTDKASTSGRRSPRDVRPTGTAPLRDSHPYWWGPFVHVGV
jgi:CHAT domain-containing protein